MTYTEILRDIHKYPFVYISYRIKYKRDKLRCIQCTSRNFVNWQYMLFRSEELKGNIEIVDLGFTAKDYITLFKR